MGACSASASSRTPRWARGSAVWPAGVFRIGHLGDLGDLSLAGALCGVEMGLARAGVPIARDGVSAALDYLGSAA